MSNNNDSWLVSPGDEPPVDHTQMLYQEYKALHPNDIIYIFTERRLYYVAHSRNDGATILPLMTYVLNEESHLVPMPLPLGEETCRIYFEYLQHISQCYQMAGYEGGLS